MDLPPVLGGGCGMNITLYCNPFFPGCKEIFSKFLQFFENFFEREENCGTKTAQEMPKNGDHRPQQPSKTALPQHCSQQQRCGVGKPGICPAQAKDQIHPGAVKTC